MISEIMIVVLLCVILVMSISLFFILRNYPSKYRILLRRRNKQINNQNQLIRILRSEFDRRFHEQDAELTRSQLLLQLENTERKLTQEALGRTEAQNRALLYAIPDLIFRINKDGYFLDYHIGKGFKLWIPPEEVIHKKIDDVFPEDVNHLFMNAIRTVLQTNEMIIFEFHFKSSQFDYIFETRMVLSGTDEIIAIVRDVSEQKRLEEEILEVSNREQIRIGQDLHDGLGQLLTGISFLSRGLSQKLEVLQLQEETQNAEEINNLVKQAISQTRALARGLLPVFEADSLDSALNEMAINTENLFGIECKFHSKDTFIVHDNEIAMHLYRITQEAVNNALKHANPTKIQIVFYQEDDTITLKIKDNGKGFPVKIDENKGMGLKIMRIRASMIGASIYFERDDNGWTNVHCFFTQE
jgi:two-component system sensor kinase FixL